MNSPIPDALTLKLGNDFAEVTGNLMVTLLEQSQDCVKLVDTEGRVGFMNRNGRCSMEIDDFCTVEGAHWWDLWPEEAKGRVREAVREAAAGRESRFEAFCPTAKGTPKWWDVTVSPVRDNDGGIFQIVSFSRDVTEQVKAREALETMAFEMRHRLRNAFALSGAVATLSAKTMPEHGDFARDLAARFALLARAQVQMMEASDRPVELCELLAVLTEPYETIACQCDGSVEVSDKNARVIALVIGELSTNSAKYGALGKAKGVNVNAQGKAGEIVIEWQENDTAPSVSTGSGQGHQLIKRMVGVSGGEFEMSWSEQGLTALLHLPAA
ncbi:MAG: PAS domain-containing protein [Novosphingobium sp.]